MRIALVGAGRMGTVHLHALLASQAIELAGIVEPFAARRQELAGQGFIVHGSVEQLLDAGAPDGVLIAAPSDQHAQLVQTFAGARVSVLCEKPLGVQLEDAATAAQAAREAGMRRALSRLAGAGDLVSSIRTSTGSG